jgi:hypothetical protein
MEQRPLFERERSPAAADVVQGYSLNHFEWRVLFAGLNSLYKQGLLGTSKKIDCDLPMNIYKTPAFIQRRIRRFRPAIRILQRIPEAIGPTSHRGNPQLLKGAVSATGNPSCTALEFWAVKRYSPVFFEQSLNSFECEFLWGTTLHRRGACHLKTKHYLQVSTDMLRPSLKSVANQVVWIFPPATTILMFLGSNGFMSVSRGLFIHVT